MNYVTVNKGTILSNLKQGANNPPLAERRSKRAKANYGHTVEVLDPSTGEVIGRFVYSPDKPLPCGARVWFETDYPCQAL